MKFIWNNYLNKNPVLNFYVGPRPVALPNIFPTPFPHLHPHCIHTPCHRQEEALLTTLSTALTPLVEASKLASPLRFPLCSFYALLQLWLAGCRAHPFATFGRRLEIPFCATVQHQGQWDGPLYFCKWFSYPQTHFICILALSR